MLALTVCDNMLSGFVDFVERLDMKPLYASAMSEVWKSRHGADYRLYPWDEPIANLLRDRPVPVTFFFEDEGDYTLAVMCFTSPPMDEEVRRPLSPSAVPAAMVLNSCELRGTFRYRARAR